MNDITMNFNTLQRPLNGTFDAMRMYAEYLASPYESYLRFGLYSWPYVFLHPFHLFDYGFHSWREFDLVPPTASSIYSSISGNYPI